MGLGTFRQGGGKILISFYYFNTAFFLDTSIEKTNSYLRGGVVFILGLHMRCSGLRARTNGSLTPGARRGGGAGDCQSYFV
jgi:hypothetical protein